MTWRVGILSANIYYDLSDGVDYVLTGLDGIAAAPVMRITERGPLQHGESDFGYRLQSRRIALALLARGGDTAAWLARRTLLMRILRSSATPLLLRIEGGGLVRQIDCHLAGALEMAPDDLSPGWQRVGIELYAPDPTWYDPVGEATTFMLGGGGALAVPLAVPVSVGASTIDSAIPITYLGTWSAFPIVTIRGPITNPIISNLATGDQLNFTGTTIGAGDEYRIDCRYGHKTVVRLSDSANRVQDLTADSHLATFAVVAHPDVLDGINSVRVRGSGLTAASAVFLSYHTRYVGV